MPRAHRLPGALVAALSLAAALACVVGPARAAGVSAQLDRERTGVGEPVTLVVAIDGADDAEDPHVAVQPGLTLALTGRARNFSWVNGRTSNRLQFSYEVFAQQAGRYTIGPVTVRVNGQELRSGTVTLVVDAVPQGGGPGGAAAPGRSRAEPAPASLELTVEPADPYVGQPVMLRARLVQRAPFAEDPVYTPPSATGFWTDTPSRPSSYYSDEPSGRVLVTETRMRMFPLASGDATIGEAVAQVVFAIGDPMDPFSALGGGRREYTLRSAPVPVHVRALPPGAPTGYTGAVGEFDVRWVADRERSARDVPFTLRLVVRGKGNIPLITVPTFAPPGFEVFAQTSDDSLGPAGEWGPGRKLFQWTVLARREGPASIAPPEFSWFDPADGRYHEAHPPAVALAIGPAAYPGGASSPGGYPAALVEQPVRAGARPVQPWAWALAGGALGAALTLARRSARSGGVAPERARALEWLRVIETDSGAGFWRAAEAASEWLATRGGAVAGLADEIRRARYGGATADPEAVRARLRERVAAALPPIPGGATPRMVALAIAVAATVVFALLGWGPPMPGSAGALRTAENSARKGDLGSARAAWEEAWDAGLRTPPLAARLTWVSLQLGDVGRATVWAMRGRRAEPRDPALVNMAARAREAGGLLGAPLERWPVRRIEWAIAALALAFAAGALWPRQGLAWTLGILALGCGLVSEVEALAIRLRPLAVVTRSCTLEPGGLELQPGQVVRITGTRGDETQVRAGEERGQVPAGALEAVSTAGRGR